MKKFEIGKSYKGENSACEITVVMRTEKTVTYTVDGDDSVVYRSKVRANSNITVDGEYLFIDNMSCAYGLFLAETDTPDAPQEPETADSAAEAETVKLHDMIDVYRVCEENGIAWTRVNADTLAIRAEDYRKLLDGVENKRYIQNLRRDTGRFCGGASSLAGTLAR